jgi:hypothetical protein
MRRLISRRAVAALAPTALLGAARADAGVDAATKPNLVDGSWILGLFFVALGVHLLRRGLSYRRAAAAMSGWPVVDAKVIESRVEARPDEGGEGADRYIPRVRYAYTVDGAARESTTIRIGLADLGYRRARQAREHAARYPAGARIAVRYDPADPTTAVLEAGQVGGVKRIVVGAIFLAAGVALIVLAIWNRRV